MAANPSQDPETRWSQLLDVVGHMLDAAKDGDWQRLAELDAQRQPMLHSFFTEIAPTLDVALVADRLNVLQSVEQQLIGLCRAGQGHIKTELQGMRRGRIAEQAYSEYSQAC